MSFFRDTCHLWSLAGLLALAGWAFVAARARLVPESFGRQGPYRTEALVELASRPSVLTADSTCHQCHQAVQQERDRTLHQAVRCAHCHGLGREHIAQARQAANSSDKTLQPAAAWDGNFETKIDLFISRDRKTCLVCHEAAVGMPAHFKKIDVAKHLEDQGASEPMSRETCFECHGGHNTKP